MKLTIQPRQLCGLLISFASAYLAIPGIVEDRNSALAMALAALLSVPLLFIVVRSGVLLRIHGSKAALGFLEKPLCFLFFLLFLLSASFSTRGFMGLTQAISLPRTPLSVLSATFMFFCIWLAFKGPEVIARINAFTLPGLLLSLAVTTLMLTNRIHPEYLFPLAHDLGGDFIAMTLSYFTLLFADGCAFIWLFAYTAENSRPFRAGVLACAGIACIGIVMSLRDTMLLGSESLSRLSSPFYTVVGLISGGSLTQNVEGLTSLVVSGVGVIRVSILLWAACQCLATVFRLPASTGLIPAAGTLISIFAITMFSSTSLYTDFIKWYWLFFMPPSFLLTLSLWLTAEITQFKQKKRSARSRQGA